MEDEQISDILRRAASIAGSAGLSDGLEPVAFRVVVETLLQEAKGDYGMIEGEAVRKRDRLKGVAINEFLAGLAPRSHTDRFLGIAYYLLHSRNELTFNIRHLEKAYILAREPKPKNFAAIAAESARRGFFTETGDKLDGLKEWQITKTGEAHVEQLLSKAHQG